MPTVIIRRQFAIVRAVSLWQRHQLLLEDAQGVPEDIPAVVDSVLVATDNGALLVKNGALSRNDVPALQEKVALVLLQMLAATPEALPADVLKVSVPAFLALLVKEPTPGQNTDDADTQRTTTRDVVAHLIGEAVLLNKHTYRDCMFFEDKNVMPQLLASQSRSCRASAD